MHPFNEAMTVNRIVQKYPRAEPVFRQLLISIPDEGCTCLDEVAWRHGMGIGELIARLEQAVDTDQPSALQSLPSGQWSPPGKPGAPLRRPSTRPSASLRTTPRSVGGDIPSEGPPAKAGAQVEGSSCGCSDRA